VSARRFVVVQPDRPQLDEALSLAAGGRTVAEGVLFSSGHAVLLVDGAGACPVIYGDSMDGNADPMAPIERMHPGALISWVDPE
jgi:hypothetical protein